MRDNAIELVVPAFEEAFYLATRHPALSELHHAATPAPFETLARLHDKVSFQQLCRAARACPRPRRVVATSDAELREAIERFPRYFARAAFSRGGVVAAHQHRTAGRAALGRGLPSEPDSPWLVQEFVDGPMHCTYSTLHDGRVHRPLRLPRAAPVGAQHRHPVPLGRPRRPRSTSPRGWAASSATRGQMSLDFVDTPDGLMLIECNPRATDGVLLMSAEELEGGLLQAGQETMLVEPGRETQLSLAVLGQALLRGQSARSPRRSATWFTSAAPTAGWRDEMPTALLVPGLRPPRAGLSLRERKQLFVAMADGICWDGEPIAGMSPEDAQFLAGLADEPSPAAPADGGEADFLLGGGRRSRRVVGLDAQPRIRRDRVGPAAGVKDRVV